MKANIKIMRDMRPGNKKNEKINLFGNYKYRIR